MAEREINIADLQLSVDNASAPQISTLLSGLGISAQLTNARVLADGDYGLVSVSGGTWTLDPAVVVTGLQSQAEADQRSDGIARQRLVRASGVAFSAGDLPVATSVDGEFDKTTPTPDTPATALQIAAGTDQVTSINPKNLAMWTARTTLTYGDPATIDWSGAESGGALTGHSRYVKMTATGDSDIRVSAIAPGLEGRPFLIQVVNGSAGAKDIQFITYPAAGGATVEVAAGVTNPGLGEDANDELWAVGVIVTVGTTGGVWKICRFIQKNAD